MKKIRDETLVPNAREFGVGFVYRDPDTSKVIVRASINQLASLARQHRTVNGLPMGPTWGQEFIDNLCANTPSEICYDEPAPTPGQKVKSVARALFDSAKSGFKTLTEEQVNERTVTCNTSGPGGGPCEYFHGLNSIFGVMCGKCGCTKLKLHLAASKCPLNRWKI